MATLHETLEEITLFRGMTEEDIDSIASNTVIRQFPKNTVIVIGFLGLWRHAAGSAAPCQTRFLHYSCAGKHVDYRFGKRNRFMTKLSHADLEAITRDFTNAFNEEVAADIGMHPGDIPTRFKQELLPLTGRW